MTKILSHKLLFVLILLLTVSTFSQKALLKKANEEYAKYEYINAQKTYLKVINKGYKSAEVYEKLGNSYYFNSQYKEASKWYKELLKNYKNNIDSEYYYRYAQTLKSINNYNDAEVFMRKFVELNPYDERSKLFLKDQDFLKYIKDTSMKYEIVNLSMNSIYSEFGTAFFGDHILFSSTRDINDEIHEWNKEAYLDFYISKFNPTTNELYEIKKWNPIFNSDLHESTPVFTKDKKTIYFTRNNEEKSKYKNIELVGKMRTDRLKIYTSTIDSSGEWSEPKPLPFNSNEYSSAHPTLSIDEKKLYFSSDMPGGKGASDLYFVEINADGTFGEPQNLGAKINTEGKETFPFISDKNNLYFSSNGHLGIGGLDVFMIENLDRNLSLEVTNLGKGINSLEDDFAFVIDDVTKRGFFSSNRTTGMGKDDIYSFFEIVAKVEKPTPKPIQQIEPKPEPIVVQIKKGDDLRITLKLEPIYFDLDKSFIRPDAAIELDKVVKALKAHPTMKIKIRSHTDSRAIWYYNTALSKRRAKSTERYLIENGIAKSRLKSWGYGESELLNRCSDGVKCSEEEHQLNRRSEFIVTEL